MAEETSLGVARARESDEDSKNSDLQHRMDEARESITDAVSEINDPAANQYDPASANVSDVFDWRKQVRKHPIAYSLGALGVGILAGYGLAGLIEGEDESEYDSDSEDMHDGHVQIEGGGPSAFTDHHSYAAHARAVARVDDERSGLEEGKHGIISRFKETRAYDRLEEEVSDLGSRFMDGIADAARTIVLPALFRKVKEMIGIDMSTKRPSGNEPTPRPGAEALPIIPSSESGKAAYPKSTGILSKFDRLASDKPAKSDLSDSTPHINLNYDDRYEQESKLFSRGEIRGFGTAKPGESKPPTTDILNNESDDVPRGGDYTYEAGHSENN